MSITLQKAVQEFKKLIEDSIRTGGTEGKTNLIRSSVPINLIHEAVKSELCRHGVKEEYIFPNIGESKGEMDMYGFLKKKAQDISVKPSPKECLPKVEEVVLGKKDIYGKEFTEKTLSINVRSQLSSAAKNFDTLYERTFAESLNLHERCPSMVLGEVYMIAIREYDVSAADGKKVLFKPLDNSIKNHVEKYLNYFQLLNLRLSSEMDKHKYEKVALLLVDFNPDIPKIYSSTNELIEDGLLAADSLARIEDLTFDSLVPKLLAVYRGRFGSTSFTS